MMPFSVGDNNEVNFKIVYYGPGLSGKTTNIASLYKKGISQSDMVSLGTETDRTLFFDFLPIDFGNIRGYKIKVQLYSVPGQMYYNATRKLVLRGLNGLVFVADSLLGKMAENHESLYNLHANLAEYGYSIETLPAVIQLNKRDLPSIIDQNEFDLKFNRYRWKIIPSIASKGEGVLETLKYTINLLSMKFIEQLDNKNNIKKSEPNSEVPAKLNNLGIPDKPILLDAKEHEEVSMNLRSTIVELKNLNDYVHAELNIEEIRKKKAETQMILTQIEKINTEIKTLKTPLYKQPIVIVAVVSGFASLLITIIKTVSDLLMK